MLYSLLEVKVNLADYLKEAGFPETIVRKGKEDLSPEFLEKLSLWKLAVNRERPVTVVTGLRSLQKDILLMLMAKEFVKIGKSVLVIDDLDIENPPQAFLIVLVMAELQPSKIIQQLSSYLSKHIFQGKALIIETDSLSALRSKYGESFYNLIDGRKIEITVPKVEVKEVVL